MDSASFWKMIDAAKDGDDVSVQAENLEAALGGCSPEEIVAFDQHFSALYCASYGWDLWGAAYLINGGCSDDSFDYFRAWLIAQGQDVFDKAVANPDSLADLGDLDEDDSFAGEDVLSAAYSAYKAVTGEDLPAGPNKYPDLGEDWDFDDDDEMRARYPNLFAKYCEG